jgi:hypothetical protein
MCDAKVLECICEALAGSHFNLSCVLGFAIHRTKSNKPVSFGFVYIKKCDVFAYICSEKVFVKINLKIKPFINNVEYPFHAPFFSSLLLLSPLFLIFSSV